MKNIYLLITFTFITFTSFGQFSISGKLIDENNEPIGFSNVALYEKEGHSLLKVEVSDEKGQFIFTKIKSGDYEIHASFIGYNDLKKDLKLQNQNLILDPLVMPSSSVQLEGAVVKARRSMVEIKPDRMVFNVEGTVNSAGDNALSLLRKAPSVVVDNNNNISVLSRTGVKIFIDGKKLPISGDQLTSYLENLPAEQIDRIDIITNPGAKYDAEGNAGIIDIRLKKAENIGGNGSINGHITKATYWQGNISANGNYRNKVMNVFSNIGLYQGKSNNQMHFKNFQNGLITIEDDNSTGNARNFYYKFGTDFYIAKHQTLGFLIGGNRKNGDHKSKNKIEIGSQETPEIIDSVLIAKNTDDEKRWRNTFNVNYVFDNKKHVLNVDLDYGQYNIEKAYIQPNRYFDATEKKLLSEAISTYTTPSKIEIYTAKADYETALWGGKIGLGAKWSKVKTDNTFLFNDTKNGISVQNNQKSNRFFYDEIVLGEYISYTRPINEKLNFSSGLRIETTDSNGDLQTFDPSKQEDPVKFNYTNFFPSVGFSYQLNPMNTLSLNYGRRINRPDYNVLNPFKVQISELSFSKGNPFLNPEIVNNIELGYTLMYRYNFKIGYSKTDNQITRLIGPDDEDPRAGYISYDNLAQQQVYSLNISAPFTINKWWSLYLNIGGGYVDNQADYGDGAVINLQSYTYTIYQQQTFKLPKKFIGEISGYYSGPGIWGGVFKYEPSWSLNLGIQKKFFKEKLKVKLSANDIFNQAGWSGVSSFDGLVGEGNGNWDSRKISLSMNYNFGNSKIKTRKRKTGIEAEESRVGKGK